MSYKIATDACVIEKNESHLLSQMIAVVLGSIFLSLMAQLAFFLPFTPVPVTMQTLGVALLGLALGPSLAFFSVFAYLTQATLGFPVIAGGICNPFWLTGPTAGYLMSFLLASYSTGRLLQKQTKFSFIQTVAIFALNELIILSIGSIWLWVFLGKTQAFQIGFIPFIPGALCKIAIATSLYYPVQRTKTYVQAMF